MQVVVTGGTSSTTTRSTSIRPVLSAHENVARQSVYAAVPMQGNLHDRGKLRFRYSNLYILGVACPRAVSK